MMSLITSCTSSEVGNEKKQLLKVFSHNYYSPNFLHLMLRVGLSFFSIYQEQVTSRTKTRRMQKNILNEKLLSIKPFIELSPVSVSLLFSFFWLNRLRDSFEAFTSQSHTFLMTTTSSTSKFVKPS